jgi:hypothetical protein
VLHREIAMGNRVYRVPPRSGTPHTMPLCTTNQPIRCYTSRSRSCPRLLAVRV